MLIDMADTGKSCEDQTSNLGAFILRSCINSLLRHWNRPEQYAPLRCAFNLPLLTSQRKTISTYHVRGSNSCFAIVLHEATFGRLASVC